MTDIWRNLECTVQRGDYWLRWGVRLRPSDLGDCPCLSARAFTTSPLSVLPSNKKPVYFLCAKPYTKSQGYENKQGNSYLERPSSEVQVPSCLSDNMKGDWTRLATFAPPPRISLQAPRSPCSLHHVTPYPYQTSAVLFWVLILWWACHWFSSMICGFPVCFKFIGHLVLIISCGIFIFPVSTHFA